jgi:hypothetical protein
MVGFEPFLYPTWPAAPAVPFLVGSSHTSFASTVNTTQYWPISGELNPSTVEANQQARVEINTHKFSKLTIRIYFQNVSLATTIRSRVNGANGNQSLAIPSGAGGVFRDETGEDILEVGDKICIQSVPGSGSTGTFTPSIMMMMVEVQNLSEIQCLVGGHSQVSIASASSTLYAEPFGSSANYATEANGQLKIKKAGTFKHIQAYLSANARTTITTLRSRKNEANGNQSVQIPGGGSARWEHDPARDDSFAVDDRFNLAFTTGTGAETLSYTSLLAYFTNPNRDWPSVNQRASGSINNANVVMYYSLLGGRMNFDSGETPLQLKLPRALDYSFLSIYVATNSLTASSTLRFRKNGANGNQSLAIPAGSGGWFTDLSGEDSCVADDLIDAQMTTGTTGTSITINAIVVWVHTPGAPAGVNINVTASDSLTLSDGLVRLAGKSRGISQSLTLADARTRQVAKKRSAADTLTLSDNAAKSKGVNRSISQNLTLGPDSLTRQTAKTRSIAQSLALGDNLQRQANKTRLVAQSLALSDSLTKQRGSLKVIAQSLTLADALTKQAAKQRVLAQSLALSDNAARQKAISRTIAQSLTLNDNAARSLAKVIIRNLSETLVLSDNAARQKAAQRAVAQSLALNDSAAKIKGVRRTITQNLTLGDQATRRKAAIRPISQSLILSDTAIRIAAKKRSIAQSLTLTDAAQRSLAKVIVRNISQSLTLGDSAIRRMAKKRALGEAITLTDQLQGFINGEPLLPPVVIQPEKEGLGAGISYPTRPVRRRRITIQHVTVVTEVIIPKVRIEHFELAEVIFTRRTERIRQKLRGPRVKPSRTLTVHSHFEHDIELPKIIKHEFWHDVVLTGVVTEAQQEALRELLRLGAIYLQDDDE